MMHQNVECDYSGEDIASFQPARLSVQSLAQDEERLAQELTQRYSAYMEDTTEVIPEPQSPSRPHSGHCKVSKGDEFIQAISEYKEAENEGHDDMAQLKGTVTSQTFTFVPAGPLPIVLSRTGPEIFQTISDMSVSKARQGIPKTFLLSFMAGVYVSFGGLFITAIGGSTPDMAENNPGLRSLLLGLLFPFALALVVITPAELFTGDVAVMTTGWLHRRVRALDVVKVWFTAWCGNFVGSLVILGLAKAADVLKPDMLAFAEEIAEGKTGSSFGVAFVRGMLANWLVCIALWQSTAALDVPGKIMGTFMPICVFVALGLEHSIANLYLVPQGFLIGNSQAVGWSEFWVDNQIPVVLGNIVGPAFGLALIYWLIYGDNSWCNSHTEWSERMQWSKRMPWKKRKGGESLYRESMTPFTKHEV
eukprot:Clim_evm17s108 gene=Clim_evmTU17s108